MESIHLLFWTCFLIGLLLIIIGISRSLAPLGHSTLILFKLNENSNEFIIEKKGRYGFFLTGGHSLKHRLKVKVRNLDHNKIISVTFPKPKRTSMVDWERSVEFAQFLAQEPGKYKVELSNTQSIILKPSPLISAELLGDNQAIPYENIKVAVKESMSALQFLSSFIFWIAGSLLIVIAFIYFT